MKNVLILTLCMVFLASCGIKPKNVDAPEGANESDFPRVYPAGSTDPDPGVEAAKIIK